MKSGILICITAQHKGMLEEIKRWQNETWHKEGRGLTTTLWFYWNPKKKSCAYSLSHGLVCVDATLLNHQMWWLEWDLNSWFASCRVCWSPKPWYYATHREEKTGLHSRTHPDGRKVHGRPPACLRGEMSCTWKRIWKNTTLVLHNSSSKGIPRNWEMLEEESDVVWAPPFLVNIMWSPNRLKSHAVKDIALQRP